MNTDRPEIQVQTHTTYITPYIHINIAVLIVPLFQFHDESLYLAQEDKHRHQHRDRDRHRHRHTDTDTDIPTHRHTDTDTDTDTDRTVAFLR